MGSNKRLRPGDPNAPFLLLGTCLLLLALCPGAAEAQASHGDAAAMRAVAKALGAGQSVGGRSYSTDPCTWKIVYCSGGRVTAIRLGNQNVSGNLSPKIRNLTALVHLELQQNRITGPLPSLAGLSSLQILLLNDNLFSSIPGDFFSGLSSLRVVSLDNNPFSPWELPASLKDTSARLMNFSANSANITGRVPDMFGTAFPSLFHLSLAFNRLHGGIPASFASSSSLQSLWLNNQRGSTLLSGRIDVVQNMTSLTQLSLASNAFYGPLPDFSGLTALQDLQLRDNYFTGPVPDSLVALPSLKKVTLSNNLLQGPVPVFPGTVSLVELDPEGESFCLTSPGSCDPRVRTLLSVAKSFGYPIKFARGWRGNDPCAGWSGIICDINGNLTVINFQRMGLAGTISPDFAAFKSLHKLLLPYNNVTGMIPPSLATLPNLKELDVSYNLLHGRVPTFASNVLLGTAGNPGMASAHTNASAPSTSATTGDGGAQIPNSSSWLRAIVGAATGGVFMSSLVGLGGFFLYKRRQRHLGKVGSPNTMVTHPGYLAATSTNGGTRIEGHMLISMEVLTKVTNHFSPDHILGKGGFGTVYRGELRNGIQIAVKRMEAGVMGSKGLNEFISEIAVLTKLRHRNLVSLLGYCFDERERLLVYEYMPQGTLRLHLFDWKDEGLKPLGWKRRVGIALDVARGVEYLHGLAHQSFIHRDLKPSNILLRDDMKAMVADFGLVRLVPDGKSSVDTRIAGTFGYLPPEYAMTGRVTTKVDVFSFGVILMELITGRKALDESLPEEDLHLVTWFTRMQLNRDTFEKAIDPTLDLDEETLASISAVSELAGHCCAERSYQRPDMRYAVHVLSSLAEEWMPADPVSISRPLSPSISISSSGDMGER